jgi:hypothetical protein
MIDEHYACIDALYKIYKKSIDAKHQRASKQEMQQVKMN